MRGCHQLPRQRRRHVLRRLSADRDRRLRYQYHVQREAHTWIAVPGDRRQRRGRVEDKGHRNRDSTERYRVCRVFQPMFTPILLPN